jgi:hypothetical protein
MFELTSFRSSVENVHGFGGLHRRGDRDGETVLHQRVNERSLITQWLLESGFEVGGSCVASQGLKYRRTERWNGGDLQMILGKAYTVSRLQALLGIGRLYQPGWRSRGVDRGTPAL